MNSTVSIRALCGSALAHMSCVYGHLRKDGLYTCSAAKEFRAECPHCDRKGAIHTVNGLLPIKKAQPNEAIKAASPREADNPAAGTGAS